MDARAETERHWGSIRDYLAQLFRYQGIEDVVADELALLPGAEELTTLLAVESYATGGAYDFVVVDCAPTGAALRLLTLPEMARAGLHLVLRVQRALASVVTPLARNLVAVPLPGSEVFRDAEQLIYRRLAGLRTLLADPCASVRLVVTPERMVIDEALRARTDLALFELGCDAIVMNRLLPEGAADEAYFRDWGRLQAERLAEVEATLRPAARAARTARARRGDRRAGAGPPRRERCSASARPTPYCVESAGCASCAPRRACARRCRCPRRTPTRSTS